jgi:hypothetical protein
MCGRGVAKAGLMSFFALWIGTSLAQEMPVQLTAEQDHQRMMALLGISSLRPGVDGSDPQAPNARITTNSKQIRMRACRIPFG